jgi:hypothetical protein
MSDQLALHLRQAQGLRALADFVEANPDLDKELDYPLRHLSDPVLGDEAAGVLAKFARAAARGRVQHRKGGDDKHFELALHFGSAVTLTLWADRNQVRERVVVGTEKVTKKVPDPAKLAEVPEIEVTETVEQVEWVCRPLLGVDGAK